MAGTDDSKMILSGKKELSIKKKQLSGGGKHEASRDKTSRAK
jgi:hypothetical protein